MLSCACRYESLAVLAALSCARADAGAGPQKKGKGDLDAIHVIKKRGGSLDESYLEEGFILEKRISAAFPTKRIENAKILGSWAREERCDGLESLIAAARPRTVANTPMDTDRIKIYGAKVRTDSVDVEAAIEKEERERMRRKCDKIAATGCNVFINRSRQTCHPVLELFD